MNELTTKQAALHDYLCERWHSLPTVRECAAHLGVTAPAIQVHLNALEKKGFISRADDKRSRGITLLIGPDLSGSEIEIAGRNYTLTRKED